MSQTRAEILLHPVRLRIVLAFGAERLTTAQLSHRLPDVAHATLYRQVAALAEAGMLEVVSERRVRGGVERTYVLAADAATLGPVDASGMSKDELLSGFVVFAGTLIDAFGRYLEDPRRILARTPWAIARLESGSMRPSERDARTPARSGRSVPGERADR